VNATLPIYFVLSVGPRYFLLLTIRSYKGNNISIPPVTSAAGWRVFCFGYWGTERAAGVDRLVAVS